LPCYLQVLFYFPHKPFNVFKYWSTRYIHRVWIGSHNSNSSTKWTNKCIMISENGGNFWSSNTNVIIVSFFNSPIMARSTTLAHGCLKTWHNQMIAILYPLIIRCCIHKGKISCIRMC
jgi:hypothetical protein